MRTAVKKELIFAWYFELNAFRSGPAGIGMPHESRGRLNIATCFVVGSIETTISVSVLYVPSFGRWSVPMRRMFSRSLPSHGGIVTFGSAEPCGGGSLTRRLGAAALGRRIGVGRLHRARRRRLDALLVARDEDAASRSRSIAARS